MIAIRNALRALAADECGATAIEYGLIVALIAVAMSGGLATLGGGTDGMWTSINDTLSAALAA